MPFSVFKFDDDPEPRIDGPPGVSVTFDIVPAMALTSPAIVGGIWPFTPSCHFSDVPVSGCVGLIALLARTGWTAVIFVAASTVRSTARTKLATSSRSVPCRCTRRRAVL